jgi:hypothetical protein
MEDVVLVEVVGEVAEGVEVVGEVEMEVEEEVMTMHQNGIP